MYVRVCVGGLDCFTYNSAKERRICVYVNVCMYVCVYVCVREMKVRIGGVGGGGVENVCVCECVYVMNITALRKGEYVYMCVCVYVCMCVCVYVWGGM